MWPYDGQFRWFGTKFDGRIFTNPTTNERWKIVQKIRERCGTPNRPEDVWQAVGVFICERVVSESLTDIGSRRILKVRMQIPTIRDTEELSEDHYVYASAATDNWGELAFAEYRALQKLTEAGCSVTPRMDHCFALKQESDLWVPGGFLVAYLMEMMPGVDLQRHWNLEKLPFRELEAIRAAFRRALEEVYALGFEAIDSHLSNVLWHKDRDTCYLIDLEYFWPMEEYVHGWREEGEFMNWGLDYPEERDALVKRLEERNRAKTADTLAQYYAGS